MFLLVVQFSHAWLAFFLQHNNIPDNSGVHSFPGLTVILSSMHYRTALIETCQC